MSKLAIKNDYSVKLLIENKLVGKPSMGETILLDSVRFWNNEGESIYKSNLDGTLGNAETNKYAQQTPFNIWLLEMILIDAKTLGTYPL